MQSYVFTKNMHKECTSVLYPSFFRLSLSFLVFFSVPPFLTSPQTSSHSALACTSSSANTLCLPFFIDLTPLPDVVTKIVVELSKSIIVANIPPSFPPTLLHAFFTCQKRIPCTFISEPNHSLQCIQVMFNSEILAYL